MRLTDLLDADVLDPSGTSIGRVHDVRLVQDGPPLGNAGATFRVEALVVGGSMVGARLGFARTNVRGPWVLTKLFGRLLADERLVPWSDVRAVGEGKIRVDVTRDGLEPPAPSS
jgi:sporulation protein YlmC with PRC-barrel domain